MLQEFTLETKRFFTGVHILSDTRRWPNWP